MDGVAGQILPRASAPSGLPAQDGVVRNNTNFSGYTSGSQTIYGVTGTVNGSYPIWQVCDASHGTRGQWNSNAPVSFDFDFGESQIVYSVKFDGNGSRYISEFEILSSDDDVTWVSRLVSTNGDAGFNEHDLDSPASARYWRFKVTSNVNSTVRIQEFQFKS
jgi:hypothetical protein